jgi:hypothetical protein
MLKHDKELCGALNADLKYSAGKAGVYKESTQ